MIRHTNFKTGFLLNEIQNPEVPIGTAFGLISREPTFDIKRFTTLLGDQLEEKELIKEFAEVTLPEQNPLNWICNFKSFSIILYPNEYNLKNVLYWKNDRIW